LIVYGSLLVGQFFVAGEVDGSAIFNYSLDDIKTNVTQYFIGAVLLSVFAFVAVFSASFILLKVFRKEPK